MKPTQEQALAWAWEAGVLVDPKDSFADEMYLAVLKRAFTLAYEAGRADENEACAKVCEGLAEVEIMPGFTASTRTDQFECASAIRARREQ